MLNIREQSQPLRERRFLAVVLAFWKGVPHVVGDYCSSDRASYDAPHPTLIREVTIRPRYGFRGGGLQFEPAFDTILPARWLGRRRPWGLVIPPSAFFLSPPEPN